MPNRVLHLSPLLPFTVLHLFYGAVEATIFLEGQGYPRATPGHFLDTPLIASIVDSRCTCLHDTVSPVTCESDLVAAADS